MDQNLIINLSADIVSAHVSNNSVASTDLPVLIHSVHAALVSIAGGAQVPPHVRKPAVPISSSVQKDTITCLECGVAMKLLKRHLAAEHGLSPREYRARWSLGEEYPLVAPTYAARRQALAVQMGLGKAPHPKRGRPRKSAAKAAATG